MASHFNFIGGKRHRNQDNRLQNENVLQDKIDQQKKQLEEEEQQLKRQKDRRRDQNVTHILQLLSNTDIT